MMTVTPEDLRKAGVGQPSMEKPKLKITPEMTTEVTCTCGNNTFKPTLLLRKVSALVSPTGKVVLLPAEAYACEKCGKVLDELNPFSETANNG